MPLPSLNNGSNITVGSGTCIPTLQVLDEGRVVVVTPCNPLNLGSTGWPSGSACPDATYIVTNIITTTDGRIAGIVCTHVNSTALNGTAVGGDLMGFLPNPELVHLWAFPTCLDLLSYSVCFDQKGRMYNYEALGVSYVAVGTPVMSTTLTGNYGEEVDLAVVPDVVGTYAYPNSLSDITVDNYGRVTQIVAGADVVTLGGAISSSTGLTGQWGVSADLSPTGVVAGNYSGNYVYDFSVDPQGRWTAVTQVRICFAEER